LNELLCCGFTGLGGSDIRGTGFGRRQRLIINLWRDLALINQ
jgi:hypothetical protein